MANYFEIPSRPENAITGSQFVKELEDSGVGYKRERDDLIANQVLAGNIPPFMRIIHQVRLEHDGKTAYIHVLPDYLCVGSNTDFVHVPLNPMTFQRICDAFGALCPTRKMVNAIWEQAQVKLAPQPMGPPKYPYDNSMMHTSRFATHSEWCQKQFADKEGNLGSLTGGHKKDVVICRKVQAPYNEKVAIYGWHQPNGKPIQGPGIQASAHEITYRDYAHGIRLISNVMEINGEELSTTEVLKDLELSKFISDEDPPEFTNPRYVLNLES